MRGLYRPPAVLAVLMIQTDRQMLRIDCRNRPRTIAHAALVFAMGPFSQGTTPQANLPMTSGKLPAI